MNVCSTLNRQSVLSSKISECNGEDAPQRVSTVPVPPVSGVEAGKDRGGRPCKEPVDEAHARKLERDRLRLRARRAASAAAEFLGATTPPDTKATTSVLGATTPLDTKATTSVLGVVLPRENPGDNPPPKPENPRASEITSSLSVSERPPTEALSDFSLPRLEGGATTRATTSATTPDFALTQPVVTPRKDDAVRQARATYLAVVREIVPWWVAPAGVVDDASVIRLCECVRTLPGAPSDRRDLGAFLVALRGHVARFARRSPVKRYDPETARAWLVANPVDAPPPRVVPISRKPLLPNDEGAKGPQPGRDTTPKEWQRPDRETRRREGLEAQAELDRLLSGVRAPGTEKYVERVEFNGGAAFWAPSPPTPLEDTTMPVDEPIEDPTAYDPPDPEVPPLTGSAAQEAIELDELREAALAAQERHRNREAEVARLDQERQDEAARAMIASLQRLAEKNPDARLAPSYGIEVKRGRDG